jgi:hypothetical protein
MIVYLQITDDVKRQRHGTLEIHYQRYGDDITFGWEWYGGPDGTDGGPADWVLDGTNVTLDLESSDTGMRGSLGSFRWNKGSVPPKSPWFSNDLNDLQSLAYRSPKVPKLNLTWWKIG